MFSNQFSLDVFLMALSSAVRIRWWRRDSQIWCTTGCLIAGVDVLLVTGQGDVDSVLSAVLLGADLSNWVLVACAIFLPKP
jgi:hypothetical protein